MSRVKMLDFPHSLLLVRAAAMAFELLAIVASLSCLEPNVAQPLSLDFS